MTLLGCAVIALSGCVSQGKYDQAVAETELTRAQLDQKNLQLQTEGEQHEHTKGNLATTRAVYKDTVHRLQRQIDAGDVQVEIRDGRMVLDLPNDLLFDTGSVDIKPAAGKDLYAVADVLKSFPDRQFQVAGHTDDVPINNSQYPSNWELSTARAVKVIHYLGDRGVKPEQLSAAGYADVDPVAKDSSPEGRKQNRRLQITLQPNITEVVRAPR